MRIAILTYNTVHNYGALLQAYALQTVLQGMGHETFHIAKERFCRGSSLKERVKGLLYKQGDLAYENFISDKLNIYPGLYDEVTAEKLNDCFDAFISGSDQVWNVKNSPNLMFFQHFVHDDKIKMSYAASLGIDKIPEVNADEFCRLLQRFDYISVREESVLEELKRFTDKNISWNIDPVFLLNVEQWDNLLSERIEAEPYIFVYGTQMSNKLKSIAYDLKKKTGLKIVSVFRMPNASIIEGKAGPLEFVNYVKYADYVVTTSFHCTAFSIIYHKKLIEVLHSTTGSRAKGILEVFNQLDSIYSDDFDFNKKWDYSGTDVLISALKETALEYLNTALCCTSNTDEDKRGVLDCRIERMKGFCTENSVIGLADVYCTGCEMCTNICPVNAIQMKIDKTGFLYPEIDLENCIHCNLCHEHCPAVDEVAKSLGRGETSIYAFKSNSQDVLMTSSSGGAFFYLARIIFNRRGVVYGCKFDENYCAVIGRAENEAECRLFQGSKYVQSSMGDCYKLIEKDLNADRWVLFSGVPCQVNAVKTYLIRKHICMEKLLLVDIICHGCPSPDMWQEHLNGIRGKYDNEEIEYISFRKKDSAGNTQALDIGFKNGKNYFARSGHDTYYNLFLKNVILRSSCYSCRFSSSDREGDITIGDFWGARTWLPEINADHMGVSQVHVNTEKGQTFFSLITDQAICIPIDKIKAAQPNLRRPSRKNIKRDEFQSIWREVGFENAAYSISNRKERIQIVMQKFGLNELYYRFKHWSIDGSRENKS